MHEQLARKQNTYYSRLQHNAKAEHEIILRLCSPSTFLKMSTGILNTKNGKGEVNMLFSNWLLMTSRVVPLVALKSL